MTIRPDVPPGATERERDDRTRRTIELLVGAERADLTLTHFSEGRVEVHVAKPTAEMPNGVLAVIATLNMLSRFVGRVELLVAGRRGGTIEAALDLELRRLRGIDTRPGRDVLLSWVEPGVDVGSQEQAAARVWIGEPGDWSFVPDNGDRDVSITFDGWACELKRGAPVNAVQPSSVPFGALSAACFAVAEVFKTLIAASVPDAERAAFRRRFTHAWRFSAWSMERLTNDLTVVYGAGPQAVRPLVLDAVLQVGAGAVGNATALAFSEMSTLAGHLRVLDLKPVDEKNLNRCFYFTEEHLGRPKVEVLEESASRTGLRVRGLNEAFRADHASTSAIVLSTVDNNEARHRMQEALPVALVEGATGGSTIAVAVHSAGNGRSCLVCRHPDPELGASRREPLSVSAAAQATGLTEEEITSGQVGGDVAITDDIIARVAARSPEAAAVLRHARDAGQDLCGALGDLRSLLGTVTGPREASVPFVSNFAGVLAAAEVVKLLVRDAGDENVPVLDNVLQLDLARDYSRHDRLAFLEPPRADCALCQARGDLVAQVRATRAALGLDRPTPLAETTPTSP
jgi:molybdopterin/thiamine biosynthesis adenylyltransferase